MHKIEMLDPSCLTDAKQLLTLQRLAYRVEADLIGFDGIPPLHEPLEELMQQALRWRGIRSSGRIVAAIAFTLDDDTCDIDRLTVDPEHFGRGYGSTLVSGLLNYRLITVSTGTANIPARRLYEKLGFLPVGQVEIAPAVTVTRYEFHRR